MSSLEHTIRSKKEALRKHIEHDPQLTKDFNFFIAKTGLRPRELLTGLWLDCNLMKSDQQTLLQQAREELWPIDEDTLKRTIKGLFRTARQVETTSKTIFSPALTANIGEQFSSLPEILRAYATELERKVNIWAPYWRRKKSRIPTWVTATRQNSLYERIRSSAGKYHQTRLLRLVNAAREVAGVRTIEPHAFAIWLNRLEKRRKSCQCG